MEVCTAAAAEAAGVAVLFGRGYVHKYLTDCGSSAACLAGKLSLAPFAAVWVEAERAAAAEEGAVAVCEKQLAATNALAAHAAVADQSAELAPEGSAGSGPDALAHVGGTEPTFEDTAAAVEPVPAAAAGAAGTSWRLAAGVKGVAPVAVLAPSWDCLGSNVREERSLVL